MIRLCRLLTVSLCLLFSVSALAWDHGVSIGFGTAQDSNHPRYTNSGFFLSSDFMSITQSRWINLTLNGALGQWHTTSDSNKDMFTAALSLALRFYPFDTQTVHPFFIASAGPAFISTRRFNDNLQGANVTFQTAGGLGFEFGDARRFDLNLRLIHFSNAGIFDPNNGYNFLYVLSIGYLF